MLRLISFINVYGGLEHDSGWALGVSRSLAEIGRYASMVSTVADLTPGGSPNIYGRYNVQDEEGRVYFSPDSIGPGSVLPNAMFIKLFGPGFWQYRAGPLFFFFISMLLASYLLYQGGGLLSIIITHLFLFFYPHLIIFLGYEAMGEIYGLAYMLLALALLLIGIQTQKHRGVWFLACGLAAGLMVITKLVGLLALSGLVVVCGLTFWEKRMSFKEGALVLTGWTLPLVAWELVQFLTLTLRFDFPTYQGYKGQFFGFFLKGGSGLDAQYAGGPAFGWQKLLVVKEISLFNDIVGFIVFLTIFLSGPFLVWRFYKDVIRRNIIVFLWTGWLTTSLWFVALAKTGWVRHTWYALMFAIFLLALSAVYFWQHVNEFPKWPHRAGAFFLTTLFLIGFVGQIKTMDFFIADKLVARWYEQHLAASSTRIPWSIVPRAEQEAALSILQQLPATGRVFYPEGYKSAEMAVLSGRIFYPLERRPLMPDAEGDVVLVGPALVSPWAKLIERSMTADYRQGLLGETISQIKKACPDMVFENNYYIICALD
jgi:hypothetical protein